jgi:CBS-domain-containing membrane protein
MTIDTTMICTALIASTASVPISHFLGHEITLPLIAVGTAVAMLVLNYFETRSN